MVRLIFHTSAFMAINNLGYTFLQSSNYYGLLASHKDPQTDEDINQNTAITPSITYARPIVPRKFYNNYNIQNYISIHIYTQISIPIYIVPYTPLISFVEEGAHFSVGSHLPGGIMGANKSHVSLIGNMQHIPRPMHKCVS